LAFNTISEVCQAEYMGFDEEKESDNLESSTIMEKSVVERQ
jgi:hypothetical protein